MVLCGGRLALKLGEGRSIGGGAVRALSESKSSRSVAVPADDADDCDTRRCLLLLDGEFERRFPTSSLRPSKSSESVASSS